MVRTASWNWQAVAGLIGLVALSISFGGCTPEAPTPDRPKVSSERRDEVTEEPAMEEAAAEAEAAVEEVSAALVAGDPAVPVSAYAPAADLAAQVPEYVKDLEEAVANEEEYGYSKDKIAKSANTLILMALALGLHDQDNAHKDHAAAIVEASQRLAEAEDFEAAKQGVEAVKAALGGMGDGSVELAWDKKYASLPALMEQVPLVHTKLKRYVRRLDRSADQVQGFAAVIAVIGQGSMANAEDTEKPDEVEKWHAYCLQMRDAAAAVNAAARAGNEEQVGTAMDALQKSCDDCHAIFHQEETH